MNDAGIKAVLAQMTGTTRRYGEHPRLQEWMAELIRVTSAKTSREIVRAVLKAIEASRPWASSSGMVEEIGCNPASWLDRPRPIDSDDASVLLGALLTTQKIQSRVVVASTNAGHYTCFLDVFEEETGKWFEVDPTNAEGVVTRMVKREVVGEPVINDWKEGGK
jgi:hypothetical protein